MSTQAVLELIYGDLNQLWSSQGRWRIYGRRQHAEIGIVLDTGGPAREVSCPTLSRWQKFQAKVALKKLSRTPRQAPLLSTNEKP